MKMKNNNIKSSSRTVLQLFLVKCLNDDDRGTDYLLGGRIWTTRLPGIIQKQRKMHGLLWRLMRIEHNEQAIPFEVKTVCGT